MKSNEKGELYVHVPFCARKCAYCDFVSFVTDADVQSDYFVALNKQIDIKAESAGITVDSVFFGGGTPSLVAPKNIYEVMEHFKRRFSFADDSEVTIEMNPNSVSKEKLKIYKEAGINRISIGLQSADNEELRLLSRLHSFEEFLKAYDEVRNAGFDNVNIDVISAIPKQTLKSYENTLNKVVNLQPEHISAYSLIIEENTPFYELYKDGKDLPDEETEREMYYLTKSLLDSCGYKRYEISNYAKAGKECRHNLGYWQRKPYLGFGIAAASLYKATRYQMHNDLKAFINGNFSEEETALSQNDMMEEFMFLGLRLCKGVSKKEFYECFGLRMEEVYGEQLLKLEREKCLINSDFVALTDKGMDVANYCMSEFIFD